MKALVIVMLLAGVAHADQWRIEMYYDQDWLGAKGVEPDGRHIGLGWTRDQPTEGAVLVLRRPLAANEHVDDKGHAARIDIVGAPVTDVALVPGAQVGAWTVVTSSDGDHPDLFVDEVEPKTDYVYLLAPAQRGEKPNTYSAFPGGAIQTWAVHAQPAWFNRHRWMHLVLIAIIALALAFYTWLAKKKTLFVRRLAGVDALEDAVGRSTEMGRPVLYVTGVEETQDIQTIASLLILGHVAKITAQYDTELRVANAYPLTMVIAEEVVRQGYANAGRADAHRPENIMFITSEQFVSPPASTA